MTTSYSLSCSQLPHMSKAVTLHLQNIDTDQIIPAEYLTLVPSKVRQQPFSVYLDLFTLEGGGECCLKDFCVIPGFACRLRSMKS